MSTCTECMGSGWIEAADAKSSARLCRVCHGDGFVIECADPNVARLAAKDAEIAELHRQLGVLDRALTGQAESRRSAESCLKDQRDAALKLLAQRDEARECVRRLWLAGENVRLNPPYFDSRHDADTSIDPDWRALMEALASTPEHLR